MKCRRSPSGWWFGVMGFVLFVGLLVLIRSTLLPELGGPRPPRFPECESEKDIPACVSLKKRFYDGCMRCHGSGYHLRAAPDLVDLLGREREFDTGVTLIADEAYIRRSIADHADAEEHIPGYEPPLAELGVAAVRLTEEEIDRLVRYVVELEPHPVDANMVVTDEWFASDPRAEEIGRLVDVISESIRYCYHGSLLEDPDVRGLMLLEFHARGEGFAGRLVETSVDHGIPVNCVKSAIGDRNDASAKDGALLARYRIDFEPVSR